LKESFLESHILLVAFLKSPQFFHGCLFADCSDYNALQFNLARLVLNDFVLLPAIRVLTASGLDVF